MTFFGIDTEWIFGVLVVAAILGFSTCTHQQQRECRAELVKAGKAASDAEAACK